MIGGEQNHFKAMVSMEEIQAEEKRFQFDHFSRKDATDLAKIMLRKSDELGMPFAIMIKLHGMIVFQYLPTGTGRFNLAWMEKKISTVELLGKSTMSLWVGMEARGGTRDNSQPIPASDIVLAGGGFPIVLKDGEIIGAIAVSGPGDQNDHYFVVESLDELLDQQ